MARLSPARRPPRIVPAERVVGDGHVDLLVAEANRGAVVLRIERDPSLEQQPAGRAGVAGKDQCDPPILRMLGIARLDRDHPRIAAGRSEEHTSELQSLMRISYAVFCLKKKKNKENSSRDDTTQT